MTPQELKESIILSAMQGKLVNQIDSEEPSVALLDRIATEQNIQIKAKKAKANKATVITEEDIPFDIPSTWTWIRFGNLVSYNMGKTPPRAESQWWGNGVPWVSIADMPESGHILETKESVTNEAINDKFSGRISKAGTLLMSFKLTVGRVSILDIDAVHNEAIISIYPYADENETIKKYLFAILPYVAQSGDSKNAIKGKTLNDTSISNLLIPLPPIAEQQRIVAKLEEILPLIDRYEATWNKLEEFNKRFPVDMQKSILQLAIQGKLVEQRPEEGTGEELFQQIQAEKQTLIKAGKIKKEKPLPEIAEDEIPFDIPDSWKWVRLGKVVKKLTDGSHNPPPNTGKGYPVISAKNVKNGRITFENVDRYTDETGFAKENPRTDIARGDIILGIIGGSIGNIAIYTHDEKVIAQRSIAIMATMIEAEYFVYVLKSPLIQNAMQASAAGSAQGGVYLGTLSNFLIPLPPIAEQKRIVAKLEEILPLCDRLK